MTNEWLPHVVTMFRTAAREPMLPPAERRGGPALDRREVEGLLPHRDPFLFIDRVVHLDHRAGTIVCQYDLSRGGSILDGHFPGRPSWPGVLQVEAIGQAGLCLARFSTARGEAPDFALTQILGAEFVRPITPGGHLEIVARLLPDGLFSVVVGQCLQQGEICCAAAVRGINEESAYES